MADQFIGKTFFLKQESLTSDWKKIIELKVSKKIGPDLYLIYPLMNGSVYIRNGGDHFSTEKLSAIFDGESFLKLNPNDDQQVQSYSVDVGEAEVAYRVKV